MRHHAPPRSRPGGRRHRIARAAVATVIGIVAVGPLVTEMPAHALDRSSGARAVHGHGHAATIAMVGGPAPDPAVLSREDFEHGTGAPYVLLDRYVGADGERYTADGPWIDAAQCNGLVLQGRTSGLPSSCNAASLRALSKALGVVGGAEDPAANHVVSAWTADRNVPRNAVQIASVQPQRVGAPGRFVSFGVAAAAAACVGFEHPLFLFSLVDGGVERPVSSSPIDPCTDPASKDLSVDGVALRGGTFVSPGGVLFSGSTMRWVMRNAQSSHSGNDGAIDGVTVYDSTPELRAEITGDDLVVGDTARLTFHVVNTSERGGKAGWSFTDTLPADLRVADDPRAATTCASGTVTATAGTSTVAGAGDLRRGDVDCVVAVDVTASSPGRYRVDGPTVTAATGLDEAVDTEVRFGPEQNALVVSEQAEVAGGGGVAGLDGEVAFRATVTNGGNTAVHDLRVVGDVGVMGCDEATLDVGGTTTCTAAPRRVTQADVDAGSVDDRVTGTAVSRLGAAVRGSAEASVPTSPSTPSIALTLEPEDARPVSVDDDVVLDAVVTNTGNVSVAGAAVTLDGMDVEVACPPDSVVPGGSVRCHGVGPYVVRQEDVDRGTIVVHGHATAVPTRGDRPTAAATTAVDTVQEDPEIRGTLLADVDDPRAGAVVTLSGVIRNTGNVTLHDVAYDVPGRPDLHPVCAAALVAPGAGTTCTIGSVSVSQADVDAGHLDVVGRVSGLSPRDRRVEDVPTARVDVARHPALDVVAEAHLAATDHDVPVAGDLVERAATVENTGDTTLVDVAAVFDHDGRPGSCAERQLAPGGATTCSFDTVALTQDDIERGAVDHRVVATAGAPDGSTPTAADTVRVGLDMHTVLDLGGHVEHDRVGALRVGDAVRSTFTVGNTGNRVVRHLELTTAGTGRPVVCAASELRPGARTTCSASEPAVVTGADEARRSFVVRAVAGGDLAVRPDAEATGPLTVRSDRFVHRLVVADREPAVPATLAFTGATGLTAVLAAAGVMTVTAFLLTVVRRRWARR